MIDNNSHGSGSDQSGLTSGKEPIVELNDVVKTFGGHAAVNGLSLSVHPGTVVAILGPNGAGKTTTVELCEGFHKPTSGTVRVFGVDPYTNADDVRRRMGIMLQGGGAYPGVRVGEMLRLVASYSRNPLDPSWLLEVVGLAKHHKTPYRRLSGGQQQRLSLACALVGRPELIFLDEPTAGLDAQSRIAVWELVQSLKRDGATVILTTHLMDEAEALADAVAIIDRGQVVAYGTPSDMMANVSAKSESGEQATHTAQSISLVVDRAVDLGALQRSVGPTMTITETTPLHYRVDIVDKNGSSGQIRPADITGLVSALEGQDVLVHNLMINRTSLEDVFLTLTGREIRQ